jgi:hypothetical protein
VGITARVFGDLRALATSEACIVLGAAVADDVMGLVVLTVVVRLVTEGSVSLLSVLGIVAVAVGFLVVGWAGLSTAPGTCSAPAASSPPGRSRARIRFWPRHPRSPSSPSSWPHCADGAGPVSHLHDRPAIFEKMQAADILVLCTPIWLGEKSSVCTQVIERLYGNSHLLNDGGQYAFYGRAGGCLITGNEDGVKHCAMNILSSLQHLGYVIPPQADAGWIG